jgi:hypothetical protein
MLAVQNCKNTLTLVVMYVLMILPNFSCFQHMCMFLGIKLSTHYMHVFFAVQNNRNSINLAVKYFPNDFHDSLMLLVHMYLSHNNFNLTKGIMYLLSKTFRDSILLLSNSFSWVFPTYLC